jgi:FMN hydrolase / 5-amino-6-(5-phospho-D-ribitylamino)uracil phosphatase
MRRYSLITFDLDDTLWDVRPVLIQAEQRVSAWLTTHCPQVLPQLEHGPMMQRRKQLLRERPQLQHQIGVLRSEAMRLALLDCGESEVEASRLANEAFAVFLAARHDVQPFVDVEESLTQLRRHYTLAALTNGNADIFRIGLGRHFSFAFRAEDLLSSKPEAPHFQAALEKTGVGAERMIHVGDNPAHDIEGAQRLGIVAIWFNPDAQPWPGAREPDAQFNRFSELPGLIASLEKR